MDPNRLLDNRSRLTVAAVVLEGRNGGENVVVIAKAAWHFPVGGRARLERAPLRAADEPFVAEGPSSIRHVSDVVDEKPGTDVLLIGTAHPPTDKPVYVHEASVRVRARELLLERTVRVHGPRIWQKSGGGVTPSESARLEPTPLVYELAWGGTDANDPEAPLYDVRNPVGRGVARDRLGLVGTMAPQLEDPRAPHDSRHPAPAGFGPIPSHWEPRAALAGTFDDAWQRERAPVAPRDFDPRHNCCAAPGLWSATPLQADDTIEIAGVGADGPWRFAIPSLRPRFEAVVAGRREALATHLDTVAVDGDRRVAELAWRARVRLPRLGCDIEVIQVDD